MFRESRGCAYCNVHFHRTTSLFTVVLQLNLFQQVAIVANSFNGENEVATGQASHSDSQASKFAYFPSTATAVSSAPTEQINTTPENQEQNVTGGELID